MRYKNIFKLMFVFTFFLLLLIQGSLALKFEDDIIKEDEKYKTIVVELPYDLYYQSNYKELWNKIYENVFSAKDFIKIKNESIISNFRDFSIPKIAEHFNATIWKKTDGYVKIIVPNESYESIVNLLKGFGLNVRKNFPLELHLSESRELIGLPYSYGGSELTGHNVNIAILDSGVNTNHPDLPWGSKVMFWNDTFFPPWDPNYLPTPGDPDGHGTHVSSIAAGTGVNSSGLYKGVAPDAFLLVWRVCHGDCDLTAAAEAIDQAINENADVISMSFGSNPQIWDAFFSNGWLPCSFADACSGNCPPGTDIQDFYDAIMIAVLNDIPVVASAGNEGPFPSTVGFPACIPDVISVGATHKQDYSTYEETFNWPTREENVELHVIISVATDNPPQVFEYAYNNTWRLNSPQYGDFYPTGFQRVIQPQNWPATIEVKIEGEHRHRNCYSSEVVWWDPGTKNKGDEYWSWEQTFAYDSSKPYITVDLGMLASGDRGGDFSCFELVDWYRAYYNTYTCSGTALSCNSFDPTDKNGCKNQMGCSWCGCWVWTFYPIIGYCKDVSVTECPLYSPSEWRGCEGTPTSCTDRNQEDGEICGSPGTTGCTASWDTYWTNAKMYRTDALSLKGLPTFYSSRGPSVFGIEPDVTAPGHEICAARAAGTGDAEYLICGNDNYIAYSGTSMAAPMVAGEIALMVEGSGIVGVNPSIGGIRQGVIEANEKVFSGNPDNEEGYGLVNAQKAVDFITDCVLKYEDGWYCSLGGTVREYRDYYYDSTSGSCTYSVIQSENCNDYDSWHCSGTNRCGSSAGDTREYWDYYCSQGNCIYSVSSSSNCRCDAYDSDGTNYEVKGTCTDYKGCLGNNCQSTGYTDYCIDSTYLREYYISGTGDSATCSYVNKKCSDLGDFLCSGGACKKKTGGGKSCLLGGVCILPY
jgi:subtilisin family serine protease